MAASEAASDADEEMDVVVVDAPPTTKGVTPAASALSSPERPSAVRRKAREPIDLGFALGPNWNPDEPASVETFAALRKVFDDADVRGDGELGLDDFVRAFRHLDPEVRHARAKAFANLERGSTRCGADANETVNAASGSSSESSGPMRLDPAFESAVDERLRHLFAVIDTNAGDTIDWDEFSTHVLLSSKETRDRARALDPPSQYRPPPKRQSELFDKQTRHTDLVTKLCRMPRVDQYATVSRDGTVRAWTIEGSSSAANPAGRGDGGFSVRALRCVNVGVGYLNDAAELPVTGRLAVAAFDRSVRVFDPKAWTEVGAYRALRCAPLCVAGWAGGKRLGPHSRDFDFLAVGDVAGHVHLLKVIDTTDGEKADRPGRAVRFEKPWSCYGVHAGPGETWVTGAARVESENAVATCGADGFATLVDVDGSNGGGKVRRRFTRNAHSKSCNDVCWSSERKIVYTCSDDRIVKSWSALSESPVAEFCGHAAPVVKVFAVDEEHQLITVGLDKRIKIWDVRTRRCIQTLFDDQEYHPENVAGGACFDPRRRCLVAATVQPKIWCLETKTRGFADAHAVSVVGVDFSEWFQRVCSADENGVVCVWDVHDGARVFRFDADADAVDAAERLPPPLADADAGAGPGDGARVPARATITAANLDVRGRRILIGGKDGSVRAWNIANGALCKELFEDGSLVGGSNPSRRPVSKPRGSPETARVTSVCAIGAFPDTRFAAAGWNGKMTLWDDSRGNTVETPRRVVGGHESDILFCAASADHAALATGDFSGDVLVWSDMGERRVRLAYPAFPRDGGFCSGSGSDETRDVHEPPRSAGAAAECGVFFSAKREGAEPGKPGSPTVLFVGYADGHVRAWDVQDGRLACAFFAEHAPGESIVAVAVDPKGETLVTGDSAGRIKLWNVAAATAAATAAAPSRRSTASLDRAKHPPNDDTDREASRRNRASVVGRDDVACLGYWQAHESRASVLSLRFFEVPGFGGFFASGGEDAAAHLWSAEGKHVGRFGPDVWRLDDQRTWRSSALPVGGDERVRLAKTKEAEAAAAADAAETTLGALSVGLEGTSTVSETPRRLRDANLDGAAPAVDPTRSSSDSAKTDPGSPSLESSSPPSPGTGEPSPTSTEVSRAFPDPYPSPPGYKPVRPVEDRALWTRDVSKSFENSRAYREIASLEERKHPLRNADVPELRARSEKLSGKKPAWHTRVYVPKGDEHINKPLSRGRPYTSLHHLIHISDVSSLPPRPSTKLGVFKYGTPIDEARAGDAAADAAAEKEKAPAR